MCVCECWFINLAHRAYPRPRARSIGFGTRGYVGTAHDKIGSPVQSATTWYIYSYRYFLRPAARVGLAPPPHNTNEETDVYTWYCCNRRYRCSCNTVCHSCTREQYVDLCSRSTGNRVVHSSDSESFLKYKF